MKWEVLKKIADADSITTKTDNELSIVNVYFTINGARIEGQFDADNIGVYGISIEGNSLLLLLNLDENGNSIPEACESRNE